MSDYRDLLEQERRKHLMRDGTLEGLRRRRDRKRRNSQIAAGVLALLIAAAGVGGGLYAFRTEAPRPADRTPSPSPSRAPVGGQARPSPVSGPIDFVDEQHGWAADGGNILVTSDGGKTWNKQYAGPFQIEGVAFVDLDRGWGVSSQGLIRTVDGGASWDGVQGTESGFSEVQFENKDVGWGIRLDPVDEAVRHVVKTTDGGQTWVEVDQGFQADSICSGTDGKTTSVWAAAGISLRRSIDGGQNWMEGSPDEYPALQDESWAATVRCTPNGKEAFVLLQDGGAAGHIAYVAYQATDDGKGGLDFQFLMQEGATHPLGQLPKTVYNSEDPYPGPFLAGPGPAYFLNWCPACSGSLPSVSITILSGQPDFAVERFPVMIGDQHGQPRGVSFLSPEGSESVAVHGWALLEIGNARGFGFGVLETTDGGRTWSSPCGTPADACFGP